MHNLFRNNSLNIKGIPDRYPKYFVHCRDAGGGFTEAVVGFAYRPVEHDRLNALVKYTYFHNVPTTDQVILEDTPVEFIQRSHIGSLDLSYDLTRTLTIGGKYAYRRGEVSLDRESRQFFDNDAHLYILRGDWRCFMNYQGSSKRRHGWMSYYK